MRHEVPYGGPSVRPHDRHVDARDPPVDEHHRCPRTRGLQHQRRTAVGGGDQQAVDTAVQQGPYVVVLEVGPLVGVSDDHAVAERTGLLLDGAGQFGEVRVEYVADDQAEGVGLVGAQRAGDGVRAVAQPLDGGQHARACVLADRRMVVQDARHRGDGHSRLGSDVLDARHRRSTSSWNRLHRRVGRIEIDYTRRLQGGGGRWKHNRDRTRGQAPSEPLGDREGDRRGPCGHRLRPVTDGGAVW